MNLLVGKIDHLVYCCLNLEDGINYFMENYGMQAVIGGRHLNEGTKNAIINLGDKCYLELLAIDKQNKAHTQNRWMGIDLLTTPKITRWAINSSNLEEDKQALIKYNNQLGNIESGLRKKPDNSDLTWKLTKPLSYPEVEVVPFLLDWSGSISHPTDGLSIQGNLMKIELESATPEKVKGCLDELNIGISVKLNTESHIKVVIDGPKGIFKI